MCYFEKNKILKLIESILHMQGINFINEKMKLNKITIRRNWLLIYSFIIFATMIMGNVISTFFSDNLKTSISFLSIIIGVLYLAVVQFISALKAKELNAFIKGFSKYDDEWLKITKNFKMKEKISFSRMRLIHKLIAIYNIFSFFMVMMFPLFSLLLKVSNLGEPSSLLYTSWYPWDVKKIQWYILTYVIQICSGFILQLILYATAAFNLLTLCLFYNDFNELEVVICNLKEDAEKIFVENRKVIFIENFDICLNCCIRRYQNIVG